MKVFALAIAAAAAAVVAAVAPAQVGDPRDHRGTATALCGRYNESFFVELGGSGSSIGASIYTGGAPVSRGGQILYAWADFETTRIDYSCRKINPTSGTRRTLRRPVRVKTGHYYYARFECDVRGRLIVHVRPLRNANGKRIGGYLSVRLEGRRPLLLAATVTSDVGALRVAPQCVPNPV